ncbi:MAG: hypothetical protein KHZ90_08180 [Veillonella parvula]|uniref:Uncharacterized protein n=1 Tax=Veillonella parvula TaxID=29466 RepID=A0A942WSP8_VEIPA|nr:hypothetical protein [Veillonella parvula]MBS4893737.1 hypothetical protein [Veillonella parvula]
MNYKIKHVINLGDLYSKHLNSLYVRKYIFKNNKLEQLSDEFTGYFPQLNIDDTRSELFKDTIVRKELMWFLDIMIETANNRAELLAEKISEDCKFEDKFNPMIKELSIVPEKEKFENTYFTIYTTIINTKN